MELQEAKINGIGLAVSFPRMTEAEVVVSARVTRVIVTLRGIRQGKPAQTRLKLTTNEAETLSAALSCAVEACDDGKRKSFRMHATN